MLGLDGDGSLTQDLAFELPRQGGAGEWEYLCRATALKPLEYLKTAVKRRAYDLCQATDIALAIVAGNKRYHSTPLLLGLIRSSVPPVCASKEGRIFVSTTAAQTLVCMVSSILVRNVHFLCNGRRRRQRFASLQQRLSRLSKF